MSAVNVNSGTLFDNNSITATTVTVKNGGALAPGVPGTPGILSITGNLAFQSGAIYLVQVTPSTASRTNVSGSATLTGATVNTVFGPGAYMSKQYEILQSGGLVGTFSGLTGTPPGGITESLSYVGNNVFLNLTANLGGGGSSTPLNQNQQAVANALNNFFNNGGALPPGFVAMFGLTAADFGECADHSYPARRRPMPRRAHSSMMTEFLGLMLDPFVDGRSGSPGSAGWRNGVCAGRNGKLSARHRAGLCFSAQGAAAAGHLRAALDGLGLRASAATTRPTAMPRSAQITSPRATSVLRPAWIIISRPTPLQALRLPVAAPIGAWRKGLGNGRSDAFQAGVYGTTRSGPAYVAGALAFANNWMTTNRIRRSAINSPQASTARALAAASRPAIAMPPVSRRDRRRRLTPRCRRKASTRRATARPI